MTERFWGIDFSGGAAPWRETISNPTVWLAEAVLSGDALSLAKLLPVQALPGVGSPFERLVDLLRMGDFVAAAIDAPFSIPSAHLPQQSHARLLDYVSGLANAKRKPFPAGSDIIALAQSVRPLASAKPLRQCEQHWKNKGVNTRSTLWPQPRGGTPFAAACLALIARSGRPCWPWYRRVGGLLVEAFPAAQLRAMGTCLIRVIAAVMALTYARNWSSTFQTGSTFLHTIEGDVSFARCSRCRLGSLSPALLSVARICAGSQ